MTGSIKTFGYEADDGTVYGIRKDESAGEATAGGVTLHPAFTTANLAIRCGIKQRYVRAVLSTDATIRRSFTIGRKTVFDALTAGNQIVEASAGLAVGGTYNIVGKTGEKSRLLFTTDTGQNDGDNP